MKILRLTLIGAIFSLAVACSGADVGLSPQLNNAHAADYENAELDGDTAYYAKGKVKAYYQEVLKQLSSGKMDQKLTASIINSLSRQLGKLNAIEDSVLTGALPDDENDGWTWLCPNPGQRYCCQFSGSGRSCLLCTSDPQDCPDVSVGGNGNGNGQTQTNSP
ncbi:hypothetical protein BVY03_04285 [bacterium K02(2017)]|nr:hypothetical protein BVY03_04285 [bacterium K02(2017)]